VIVRSEHVVTAASYIGTAFDRANTQLRAGNYAHRGRYQWDWPDR
jgi:hypothetical protein